MVEVDSETEEPVDDAEDVGRALGEPFGFVSETQSHYTFSQFQQRQDSQQEDVPPDEEADDFQDVEDLDLQALGLGLGLQNLNQEAERLAQPALGVSPPRGEEGLGQDRLPPLSPLVRVLATPPRDANLLQPRSQKLPQGSHPHHQCRHAFRE